MARDFSSAFRNVSRGLALAVESGTAAELGSLADLAAVAARESDQIDRGLKILNRALRRSPPNRVGPLLAKRSSLWGYLRRYPERTRDLRRAAAAFSAAGDREGECRVLGEMALPVDVEMPLSHRVQIGLQALAMAEDLRDPALVSLCATNTALSKFLAGDASALDLRRHLEANPPTRQASADSNLAMGNWLNWAQAALAFGLTEEVEEARRVLAIAPDSLSKRRVEVLRSVVQWRRGDWDQALATCESLASGPINPEDQAVIQVVAGAIDFQQRSMLTVNRLGAAADLLAGEDPWGGWSRAIVIDIRRQRREPRPTRGARGLVTRIRSSGVMVGWEDLLPAVARATPDLYTEFVSASGNPGPLGKRAHACLLSAQGFAGRALRPAPAGSALEDAADAYGELAEPFERARCLEAAASIRNREGRKAGGLWREAAGIYRDLGALRALTTLLRTARGTRALTGFSVPETFLRAPSSGLTSREQEVADLARRGFTAPQIGQRLSLSPHTVRTHFKHIRQKLQVGSKNELIQLLSDE